MFSQVETAIFKLHNKIEEGQTEETSSENQQWILLDLCFPAAYDHNPPWPTTSVVFIFLSSRPTQREEHCSRCSCTRAASPRRATAPSSGRCVSRTDFLLVYLISVHTREQSFKPAVRTVWLSAEKDALRTPPKRHEWHCRSMCRSCRCSSRRSSIVTHHR